MFRLTAPRGDQITIGADGLQKERPNTATSQGVPVSRCHSCIDPHHQAHERKAEGGLQKDRDRQAQRRAVKQQAHWHSERHTSDRRDRTDVTGGHTRNMAHRFLRDGVQVAYGHAGLKEKRDLPDHEGTEIEVV